MGGEKFMIHFFIGLFDFEYVLVQHILLLEKFIKYDLKSY